MPTIRKSTTLLAQGEVAAPSMVSTGGKQVTSEVARGEALVVANVIAAAGTVVKKSVRAELGPCSADVPLILVNGRDPGPRLTIVAGVHASEFVGVEASLRTAEALDPARMSGQVVICPVANPPAFFGRTVGGSPLDARNMNRLFPGDESGSPTARLAAFLFDNLIKGSDAYLDLHSGEVVEDLSPFVAYRQTGQDVLDSQTAELAHAYGLRDVLVGTIAAGGNSHAAASRVGVRALLVEIGAGGSREEHHVTAAVDGILRIARRLGILSGSLDPVPTQEWRWAGEAKSPIDGMWFPRVAVGEEIVEGQVLGYVTDLVGEEGIEIVAPCCGRIFYGLRSLSMARGDTLAAIATPDGCCNGVIPGEGQS